MKSRKYSNYEIKVLIKNSMLRNYSIFCILKFNCKDLDETLTLIKF